MKRHWMRTVLAGAAAASAALGGLGWTAAPATAEGQTITARTVLVLDSSGSMAEPAADGLTKMDAAKSALRTVVADLPAEAEVGLRVLGATVAAEADPLACADSQLIVPAGRDNRDELRSAIDTFAPFGQTPIPVALQEAAKDVGTTGLRSIVLVSDGESTCAPDVCRVAKEIVRNGTDLHIDVVGLTVSDQARAQLQCIADNGNGTYVDADGARALAEQITYRLAPVTHRSVRPIVQGGGGPIVGGTLGNPTPVTVGVWSDSLAPQEEKSYAFSRASEGSGLRVSAVGYGPGSASQSLRVRIFDPDGDECASGSSYRSSDSARLIGAGAGIGATGRCPQAGTFRIAVKSESGKATAPFELRVSEEPPVASPGSSGDAVVKVTPPAVTGTPQATTGGDALDTAPALGAGRWSANVVPGEAALFRLPLTFGQYARIGVTFPPASDGMLDVIDGSPTTARIALYDPMAREIGTPKGAETSGYASADWGAGGPITTSLFTVTSPVSLSANPAFTLTDNSGGDFHMAGDYFLGISLDAKKYTIEFPFTIDVEILGEPQPGPAYIDGAAWTVSDDIGAGEQPGGGSQGGGGSTVGSGSGSTSGSASRIVLGVGAGAIGIGLIAGAAIWWRRTRTT